MSDNETRTSAFMITINTNQSVSSKLDAQKKAETLKFALDEIFGDMANYSDGELLKFTGQSKSMYDYGFDLSDLINIDSHSVVELGEKARGGRIHSHTILTIAHQTSIHVNTDGLADMLKDRLYNDSDSKPYINVRVIPSQNNGILGARAYVDKNLSPIEKRTILEGNLQAVEKTDDLVGGIY